LSPARRNFYANICSLIVRTFFTIVLVPFYILNLGNDLYSDWIILYTLPSLFELANLGVNHAVNTTFSIHYNNGNKDSYKIINHGLFFTLSIWFISILFIFLVWDYINAVNILGLDIFSSEPAKIIMLLLTSKIFLDMIRGSLCSYFFAHNINHFSIYINLIQYVLECLIILFLIYNSFSLIVVSYFIAIPALLSCIFLFSFNYFYYGYRFKVNFQYKYINLLFKPSLSFSILTVSEYILNQCFLILIKRQFSNDLVVVYNTTRTLTNYIKNIQGQFATAVVPVFNFYFSKGLKIELIKLYKKTTIYTVGSTVTLCILLILFKDYIWFLWLKDQIILDSKLLYNLVIIQLIGGLWIVSSHFIMSLNKHLKLSIYFFVSSASSIILFYIFSLNYNLSVSSVPLFLGIHHLIMIIYCFNKSFRIFKLI
jgi:O-antigen/teichoic acid export membrane protein